MMVIWVVVVFMAVLRFSVCVGFAIAIFGF